MNYNKILFFKFLAIFHILLIFIMVDQGRALVSYSKEILNYYEYTKIILILIIIIAFLYSLTKYLSKIIRDKLFKDLLISLLISILTIYIIGDNLIEIIHVITYSSLYLLIRLSIIKKNDLLILSLCVLISFIDELLQWIHPERVFDLRDLSINFLSSLLALFIFKSFKPLK